MIIGNRQISQTTFYQTVAYTYLATFVITSIFLGLSPILFALFTAVGAIFILAYAELGLWLIIVFTMLFERFFTLQPLIINQNTYKLYPLDIVMGLLIFSILFSLIKSKNKNKITIGWPEKLILLFITISGLYFIRSLFDINADFDVAFSSFKNYAFYPLLYFITIYLINDAKKFKHTLHTILISGVLIIGFIIIGVITGQGLWTEYTPLSTAGVRLLAGTHAFYLVLCSLIVLSLLAYKRFFSNQLPTMILWIWSFGIAMSLMRHLWLGLVFGGAVIFALIPRKNKKILASYGGKNILTVFAILVVLIMAGNIFFTYDLNNPVFNFLQDLQIRAASIGNTSIDTSVAWRFSLWQSAQEVWLTNPIFGIGLGHIIPLELDGWRTFEEVRNLHNSLLAILVQMGLLGLISFLGLIASVLITSRKKIFNDQNLTPYYIGLYAGVAVILFCSLFQPYFETNLTAIFLWIFLGLIATSRNLKT
ncbi:MAG: O-antigen ligase family protein [bacterium]